MLEKGRFAWGCGVGVVDALDHPVYIVQKTSLSLHRHLVGVEL